MGGEKTKYFAYGGIAVFILAIIYFIVSVYSTMLNGESRSQHEFSSFVYQSGIDSFSSVLTESEVENFYNTMRQNIENNSHILAAVITVSDEPVFAYPMSSNVIHFNAEQKPSLIAASPMLKTYSMSLPSQRGQHIVLNAVVYILRPADIYNSARISFLIILAYTLFLIVVIVYYSLSKDEKKTEKYSTYQEVKETKTSEERETIPVVFREQDGSWDDFFVENTEDYGQIDDESAVVNEESSASEEASDNNDAFIDSFVDEYIDENADFKNTNVEEAYDMEYNFHSESDSFETETLEQQNDTANSAPEQDEGSADSTVSQINDPMGLFSDITGVGWESYMETRLDSELIRSASSEQDLALLFIRLKGIEKNIIAKKKVATLLLEYFKYRDFVFEYKDDGFAGILLDVNLDQTMILSEQLFQQLQVILRSENIDENIGIGVSTRSLRILPGSRIITEAEQAVARAFEEEDLPIVAFRVSPEKYRQFVNSN